MKARKIFLGLTISMIATLTFGISGSPTTVTAKPKAAETPCEKIQRLIAPKVAAFQRKFAASPSPMILTAIQDSDSVELARGKYVSLTPEKRKAVWRAKFDQIAISKYAPARARIIEKGSALIDTLKFDGTDDIQPIKAFEAEAKEVFDKSEMVSIFGSLTASPSLMKAMSGAVGKCNCNLNDEGFYCPEGYPHCFFSPGIFFCTVSDWGCSLFWVSPCNGMCA